MARVRTHCSTSSRKRARRAQPAAGRHNPGIGELAAALIASGDVEARQRLIEKFPTAALAVIDFALDDWTRLHPRGGRLDRFVVPRSLESATD
jgi:phosphohistidine phosphatase